MKKRHSLLLPLLPALLLVLLLVACGSKMEPEKTWTIRNDDYNYTDRYLPFDDYDAGPDYWARDVIQAERELEPSILYVKNRESGEITQISDDPVVSFAWNFGNTLLYATEKGELWRSGINGEQKKILYSSNQMIDKLFFAYKGLTNQENELTYVWPKDELFFLDGNMIVDLDLQTGEAERVTEVDTELFYAFYPWIDGRMAWNNVDGNFRSYDPETKSIAIISEH